MNSSLENNLEQKLFEQGAEKCTSQDERINFCKKYLNKFAPAKEKTEYKEYKDSLISKEYGEPYNKIKVEPVHVYHVKKSVANSYLMASTAVDGRSLLEHIKADLANELFKDAVDKGFIIFETFKNPVMDTTDVHAAIKMAKWGGYK